MNKKQTAVEFFMEELLKLEVGKKLSTIDYINKRYAIKNKALQMERKQLEEAYNQGFRDAECEDVIKEDVSLFADAKIYYAQTYGECTQQ